MTQQKNTWQDDFDHWIQTGTAKSTRRGYQRDVKYFWTWIDKQFNEGIAYPASLERILQFCLYHIDSNSPYPLKLVTIRRYLSSLSVSHSEHGVKSPILHPQVKLLLRRAKSAKNETPKKKAAITLNILEQLIGTCDYSLKGVRDKAVLLVGFASGGRRREELAHLLVEDVQPSNEGYLITIRKSKNDKQAWGLTVPLKGAAALALTTWLVKSGLRSGPLFRGIKYNDAFYEKLSGRAINLMVKRRITLIGLNPDDFGAHSLRAGFLTEATRQGISLTEAMMLSGHKSIEIAQGYCRTNELLDNKASQLIKIL